MMRRIRGFTLVELLVVFAILGLLMALVPVAFDRLREGSEYRDVVRGMMAQMRVARHRSVAEGREVAFTVDVRDRQFGMDGVARRALPPSLVVRAIVAESELQPDGSAAIRFLPRGGATGGSVEIVRPSGAGIRLRVDWLSGRVTQEELTP